MTPYQLASLQTRVTRYCGEDKRERAVLLWDDWMDIVQDLTPIETDPPPGSETCAKCGLPGAEYEVRLPEYAGKRYHALCCPEVTPYPGD